MSRFSQSIIVVAGLLPGLATAQSPPQLPSQSRQAAAVDLFQDSAPAASSAESDSRTTGGMTLIRHAVRPAPRIAADQSSRAVGQADPRTANRGGAPTIAGPSSSAGPTHEALDPAVIAQRMQEIENAADLDAETKAALLEACSATLESVAATNRFQQTVQQIQLELQQRETPEELRAAIDSVKGDPVPQAGAEASLDELEQLVAGREAELTDWRQQLAEIEQSGPERERRARELPGQIHQTQNEITDTAAELSRAAAGAATLRGQVSVAQLRARGRMLEGRLAVLTAEQRSLKGDSEILALHRELAEKQIRVSESSVAACRNVLKERRRAEAENAAREAREILASSHPSLQAAAQRNSEIADERTALTVRLEALLARQAFVDALMTSTTAAFADVRQKYEAAGETTALGFLMRNYRTQLPEPRSLRAEQRQYESELPEAQLTLLTLKDELSALPAFEAQIDGLLETMRDDLSLEQRDAFRKTVGTIRADRRNSLVAMISDYETLLTGLSSFNFATDRLLETRDSLSDFINEHILWIRSAEPVTRTKELSGMTDALHYLVSPSNLNELAGHIGITASQRPLEAMLTLAIFVVALAYGRRFRNRLKQSASLPETSTNSIAITLLAVCFSLLAASVWPLLIALAATRLSMLEGATPYAIEFAAGLGSVATLMLTASVIRQLCRVHGVGEQFFGWNALLTRLIRRSIGSAMLLGCPLAFGVSFLSAHGDKHWIDSLGRLLFIAGMFLAGSISHRVLHLTDGLFAILDRDSGPHLGVRSRRAIYWFGLFCPVALGLLAATGYFFTAQHLASRLVQTIWLVTAVSIGVSLARRWLAQIVQTLERRLMHRQVVEAQQKIAGNTEEPAAVEHLPELAAELDSESTSELAAHAGEALAGNFDPVAGQPGESSSDVTGTLAATELASSPHVTITPLPGAATATDPETSQAALIQQQLRQLTNMAATVLMIVGSWSIWSSVLPALGVLDRFELSSTTVITQEVVTASDGTSSSVEKSTTRSVTLRHALIAIGLIVITHLAAKNLPGLLEAVLFQRLPLDAGGRYAATTLSRYAVTTAGWCWAFSTVGVTWSGIQWLVAAMTVGLGFGLQEIFGNLVSGLILLFERPVRVGDLVTVGGTTGTVTRMKIRATTITDPDRRELVVPNKKFITDEFINWTLSDPITRVVFKVGVAYGSDTSLTHQLLMDVARQHPLVLEEPAPSALMTGFGDSTLDFELRIFIASRSSYVAVVHDLNTTIDRVFSSAGIEIAFPQRDINIRAINGLERVLPFPTRQEERRAA